MKYTKIIGSIFFLFMMHELFAQTDSLLLFTKKGCSNCAYAKKKLSGNKISFYEFEVDQQVNAKHMLAKLRKAGYKGKMFMPAIFLNDQLIHPAYAVDTSLKVISLASAVDSIIEKNKNGSIHLPKYTYIQSNNTIIDTIADNDCEMKQSSIYLVCANFTKLSDAEKFVKMLTNSGYKNANTLNYKKYFRVYAEILDDAEVANSELQRIQKQYRGAYTLLVK